MAGSGVGLSIGTIISMICVACLSIGFSTENWHEIRVDRNASKAHLTSKGEALPPDFKTDVRFFSRDEGLFRICFVDEKPKSVKTYFSPTRTECLNVNYYIPGDSVSDKFSDQRWKRLQMGRAVVAFFAAAFFLLFLSFFTGIAGRWLRSHAGLVATGVLHFLASLFAAGGMGLWHAVLFYEQHKLKDELSYSAWPEVLKEPGITKFYFGWSYILYWIGTALCFLTAIIFLYSARCIRREKATEKAILKMQYVVPVYPDTRSPYGPAGNAAHYAAYPPP